MRLLLTDCFSFLLVFGLIFLGMIGVSVARWNVLLVLVSIELIILSVNLFLVLIALQTGDAFSWLTVLWFFVTGGAEAAIGLAIFIVYYRLCGSIGLSISFFCKG